MLKKFLIGDGFVDPELNSAVISTSAFGDVTLYKLLSQIAHSVSRHNAASIAVKYSMDGYKVAGIDYLPYRNIRYGQSDSQGFSGKIHYYNNWHHDPTIPYKETEIQILNNFNPKKEVVEVQWSKQKRKYRGQIAVLRLDDEYIYPLSPIDSAIEDADTEAQIKYFKNSELNRGFFAKYILWHTNFADAQEQEEFKAVLKRFQGGDHDSSILMAEAQFDPVTGSMRNDGGSFKLEKLEQNVNDKIFESYERSTANNIRKSFFSIPSILIEQQDGSFFGSSGEAFKEAFSFYNTQTKDIRAAISQWLTDILQHSDNPALVNANYTIKNLSYGTLDIS